MTFSESAKPENWYDKHVSKGNIINMLILVFLVGGAWFVMEHRMSMYEGQIQRHDKRLDTIENLQVRMAEVVLQQSQITGQIGRLEGRMDDKYRELLRRLELLENTVYRRPQAD